MAKNFTDENKTKLVNKMAHKLLAKIDIKTESHINEIRDLLNPFEEDILNFVKTVKILENSLYTRNNLSEFEQNHVMYDTPKNMLIQLLSLTDILIGFLTKFD